MKSNYFVSPDWLKDNLHDDNLIIVEAPWKEDRYNRAHITAARQLPWHSYLKANDDDGNRLPEVLSMDDFTDVMNKLGITQENQVVVYDDFHGLFASRFWWVCAYYGFHNVKLLDGGWHGWIDKGYPLSIESPSYETPSTFSPSLNASMNITLDELRTALENHRVKVWDTRRLEEYDGSGNTANKRTGHMPGAVNLEWKSVLANETYPGGPKYLKPLSEIENTLASLGLTKDCTIITHCQASIRGAYGSLILEMLGYPAHRLYDAAMAEWANREDTPLCTSAH